jgi:uncharacterized membrane protein
MKNLCWTLVGLAALAFAIGAALAFNHAAWLLEPQGYWRGAIGLLLFAIAIKVVGRK